MAAYLIVDVDDLLHRFSSRGINVDLQELAVGLRGGAALAAGLFSADSLKAVAVSNWGIHGSAAANYQRTAPLLTTSACSGRQVMMSLTCPAVTNWRTRSSSTTSPSTLIQSMN